MKKLILLATFLLTTAAQAQMAPAPWQKQLEDYKANLSTVNGFELQLAHGWYIGAATTTCSLAFTVAAATFVADTIPVTNIISEGLANVANPDYKTLEKVWSLEAIANTGRGAVGGATIAVGETLEFILLWLGGNEALSYKQTKEVYASTVATVEAMFASQGQCAMSFAKLLITRAEIANRNSQPSPLVPPAVVNPRP